MYVLLHWIGTVGCTSVRGGGENKNIKYIKYRYKRLKYHIATDIKVFDHLNAGRYDLL